MNKVYKLGELFCGPGGIACGAMKAKSDDGSATSSYHMLKGITNYGKGKCYF